MRAERVSDALAAEVMQVLMGRRRACEELGGAEDASGGLPAGGSGLSLLPPCCCCPVEASIRASNCGVLIKIISILAFCTGRSRPASSVVSRPVVISAQAHTFSHAHNLFDWHEHRLSLLHWRLPMQRGMDEVMSLTCAFCMAAQALYKEDISASRSSRRDSLASMTPGRA